MARFAKYFFACCAVVAVFLLLEFCKVYITETIYNRCIRSDYPMPSASADLAGLAEVFLYFGLRPIAGKILIGPLFMLVLYHRLSAKTGVIPPSDIDSPDGCGPPNQPIFGKSVPNPE